jgi:hypothetical protein
VAKGNGWNIIFASPAANAVQGKSVGYFDAIWSQAGY